MNVEMVRASTRVIPGRHEAGDVAGDRNLAAAKEPNGEKGRS